jgi:type IV pilus assembly protein PilY1
VVASGLNGGGQGVFALDVTDPTDWISETSVAAKVLWEFTDADTDCSTWSKGDRGDCDLGFTFSRPNIVRLNNGKWAAIFGNGYNSTVADGATSTTGDAVLFVVDIETGGLISKISTKEGASDDPLGESRPNGLASVAPVDVDGDFIVDYVYAGDLFGNLWKFNLNDPDEDNWGVAFGSKTTPAPLYVARSASDDVQPITTRPQVMRHPMGGEGFLVLFGTGKYLEVGDNSAIGQVTQSFYGILDAGTAFTGRGDLLQQSILAEVTATTATDPPVTYDYRVTSNAPITWGSKGKKGWYLDLVNTEDGGTANFGERQVSDAILRGGRIIFTTLVPESDDPCNFGGTGWLMELDAASGGRLEGEIFDVNGDGVFTMADVVDYLGTSGDKSDDVLPSGRRSKEGIIPMPAILARQAGGKEFKYLSGSTGNIEVVSENPGLGDFGRQSWQQLLK